MREGEREKKNINEGLKIHTIKGYRLKKLLGANDIGSIKEKRVKEAIRIHRIEGYRLKK